MKHQFRFVIRLFFNVLLRVRIPVCLSRFFSVFQCRLPIDVGVTVEEVVMMVVPIRFGQVIRQLAVRHRRCFHAGIGTGLVEGDRVKGSEHADVWQDRRIVSAWQSQFGETSMTRLMWKHGRSWQTAWAYSAILRSSFSLASHSTVSMASKAQAPMQRPQPLHRSSWIWATLFHR